MLKTSVEIRVRYQETDQMGIVHHANYFIWFESARITLLDLIGYPYIELEREGYFLPVLSCRSNFLLPARFDDQLEIGIEFHNPSRVRFEANYKVIRKNETLATGRTIHAFVSNEGKIIRPPQKFLDRINTFTS